MAQQYFVQPSTRMALGVVNAILGVGLYQVAPLAGRMFFGVGAMMIGSSIRQRSKQVIR